MKIEGRVTLSDVSIQTVYKSLLKPEVLSSCIPGVEEIEQIDEQTYDCVIKQSVGPVSMKFKARNVLTNLSPPKHIELEGEGDILGSSSKFVHSTEIDLEEKGKEVEIICCADVGITGPMEILGNRVIKAKAKNLEDEIAGALQKKLQGSY